MKKTKNIILKEYETTEPWDLNSKDILEAEKLNKISKTEIFEIKANNIIRAKQYVWIVKINNKNIQVLPKIFWDNNEKITKNLLYMLSYTKKLNIKESDIANLWKIDNLFEIFIYIFSKWLIELLKKDFKKNYNLIQENSSFLKWKLLFSKHIKINLFNKSKFFIKYEKMDENILLNIFFNSLCNKLLKKTKSNINYKLLSQCCFILKDIDNKIFKTAQDLKSIKLNKKNISYKSIFSLWKMLYFWNSPDFSKNLEDNFSLLFDMNLLFEEFIVEFMKRNTKKIDQNINSISSQVANKYVFTNNKFTLKPDILVSYKDDNILIIDTKYKKLNKDKSNFWVSSWDIYQMFVYWMRYFWKFNIEKEKKIILLYPNYNWENYNKEYLSEENIKIKIKTIDMNFDLSNTEWKTRIINWIKNIL